MRYTTLIGKIRPKHAVLAAALLSPPAALLVLDALWHTAGDRREFVQSIIDLGYSALVPPSTIHLPGTINTVEFRTDGSVRLYPTCRMDREVLEAAVRRSMTITRQRTEEKRTSVDARASMHKTVASTSSGEKARSARLSLDNTRILFLSDEMLINIQKRYIKDECQEAILYNLSAGALVCQAEEVLQADAVYRTYFRNRLAIDQRMQIARRIKVLLGFSEETSERRQVQGDELFYGVRFHRHCIVMDGAKPAAAPLKVALRR